MSDIRPCSSSYTVDRFEYEHIISLANGDSWLNSISRSIAQQLANFLLDEDMIDFKTVYRDTRVEIVGTCGVATKQTVVDKQIVENIIHRVLRKY